jgi:cysteine synthase
MTSLSSGSFSNGIVDAIGDTPLIELKSLSKLTGRKIFGKCEFLNPGGSVKDRPALRMVEEAEQKGLLKPGYTLVEGTGGNTGVGLALVCAAKGYKCIFAMPKSIAEEKINSMKRYGAEVLLCESVPFTDKRHYFHVAAKLGEKPNYFFTNQFENLSNGDSHFHTTGPEIYKALGGKVNGFICAAGTGGTINGVSRYLKSKNKETIVYLADCVGSGMFDYLTTDKKNVYADELLPNTTFIKRSEGSSVTEGIGIGRLTLNFLNAEIDGAFQVSDVEAIEMAYHLLRNDGVYIGPSASLNVVGAVKLAKTLPEGSSVVTILCDGGDRYKSKIWNEKWLKEKALIPEVTGNTIDFVTDP